MKSFRTFFAAGLLAGLAGCDSIGDGNTIERLDLVVAPLLTFEQGIALDAGTATERFHMYDCFCSNLAALVTFNDGGVADFSRRVTFTSDNPSVLTVLSENDLITDRCPLSQQSPGLVVPMGIGTATVSIDFGPLHDSIVIEVADAAAGSYVLRSAPPNDPNNTDVAVGGELSLRVTGTLDGRSRTLNRSVTAWSFDDDTDGDFATVDSIGVVRGVAPTGLTPKTASIEFAACNDVTASAPVRVGDVLEPLTLDREAPDFATDGMLAEDSDEELVAKAPLDFDGDASPDGEQLVSDQVALAFTDSCILREFDASVPTTNCRETPTTCANEVRLCEAGTGQLCPSSLVPCRTEVPPVQVGSANQIRGVFDNGAPTLLKARFPAIIGTPATLALAIDSATTEIEVDSLLDYPDTFPWFAVIDSAGTREDVRVTAADGTTLTVVRGIGGTAAAAHALGATFEQRAYNTDGNAPLQIRGKQGDLTVVAIDPPGTLDPLGTLQLRAEGTFVDNASASRQQRVTRLIKPGSDGASVNWLSTDATIATVSLNNGLMFSQTACGGRVSVRARATSSTDDTTASFDSTTTADDDACRNTDPLCDQVEVCIETQNPLPLGVSCPTTTTCP